MSPVVIAITLCASLMVCCLPRPTAALGVIVSLCYVTQGETLDVGGFHFTAIRMVLLAGILGAAARGDFKSLKYNRVDRSVVVFCLICAAIAILREHSTKEVIYQFGVIYNQLLPYFLIRSLFRNCDDVKAFLPGMALTILPFALIMGLEATNGHNMFSGMGGVPAYDEFRDGHYRCAGPFRSPITAGTFGATFMPFFAGLFLSGKSRQFAVVGFLSATLIMFSSHSSGPLIAYVIAFLGLLSWKLRLRMQTLRRVFVATLALLQMVMKAPVWFLMARISDLLGGGGYHRAEIVDQCVNHFSSWWLIGMSDTGGWIAYQLADGTADLTNQFVVAGVTGGLVGLLLFVRVFVRCFGNIGSAMTKVRESFPGDEKLLWALGCSLFATVVNFFSVSYFDQIGVAFWLVVAVIASATGHIMQEESSPESPAFGFSQRDRVFNLSDQWEPEATVGSGLSRELAL